MTTTSDLSAHSTRMDSSLLHPMVRIPNVNRVRTITAMYGLLRQLKMRRTDTANHWSANPTLLSFRLYSLSGTGRWHRDLNRDACLSHWRVPSVHEFGTPFCVFGSERSSLRVG